MPSGLLYISYDGLFEPLGQSQVLAYLERLAKTRVVFLITFEKYSQLPADYDQRKLKSRVSSAGIFWVALRYHKRPTVVATAWDIFRGAICGFWLIRRHRLEIVHARSYVPSVIALLLKRILGTAYIFDMRGFWADERVDGGLWPRDGLLYRIAKWFESRFLLSADHVVSLTESAVDIMKEFDYLQGRFPKFSVIPTCADLERFRPACNPHAFSLKTQPFVLGYLGSVGTWYSFDHVITSYALLLRIKPDARFLIVNRGEHGYIRERLRHAKISEMSYRIVAAEHHDVPALIAQMSAGIFFIRPTHSKQASSPTKLAEFLGCGVPCLSNDGVGDMSALLNSERVGVVVKSFDDEELKRALVQLLDLCAESGVSTRCIAAAKSNFSLDEGITRYQRIYELLDSSV